MLVTSDPDTDVPPTETKLLVDLYQKDWTKFVAVRNERCAYNVPDRRLKWGPETRKVFHQWAASGAARYMEVRKQVAAERQARLPHANGWSQPIMLPQPTGQVRSRDGRNPIDHLDLNGRERGRGRGRNICWTDAVADSAFCGGFSRSMRHGTATTVSYERVRLSRYLRERYGRETAFGYE